MVNFKKHFIILVVLTLNFFDLSALSLNSNSMLAKKALLTLEKLQEYQILVKEVEKDGPVKIEVLHLKNENFDAFWDSTTRTIKINLLKNENFNVLICSILFELHNAKSDKRFKHLYTMAMKGQISKEKYVENVERMEHENALNCSLLLEKGIRLGFFSPGARWPILRNFDDHYKLQQITEHSHWLAASYEKMAPPHKNSEYIGTLPKLTKQDKEDLVRYLKIKNDLEGISEEQALKGIASLQKEYINLESCYLGASDINCRRTNERIKLLELVFKDNKTFQTLIKDSPLYTVKR